jgi:hypothetical protein
LETNTAASGRALHPTPLTGVRRTAGVKPRIVGAAVEMTFPIDGEALARLVGAIVRGSSRAQIAGGIGRDSTDPRRGVEPFAAEAKSEIRRRGRVRAAPRRRRLRPNGRRSPHRSTATSTTGT